MMIVEQAICELGWQWKAEGSGKSGKWRAARPSVMDDSCHVQLVWCSLHLKSSQRPVLLHCTVLGASSAPA